MLVQTLAAAAAVGGCRFDAPSYEGTSYACEAPDERCPPGFRCVGGRCIDDAIDAAVATRTVRAEVAYDTSIRSDAPTANDGALDFLEMDAAPRRVSLVFVDFTVIATDAQVVGAEFHASVFDPIETGAFQLYPITESWTETAATWEQREPGVPWSGGLSVPTLDANALLGEAAPRAIGATAWTLDAAIIQGWIATPPSNFGFAAVSSSPDGRGGQMRSSEYATADERPYVLVTLVAP